jgi:hypothetical protein
MSYLLLVPHDSVRTRLKLACGAHTARPKTCSRPSPRRSSTPVTGTRTRAGERSSLSCKSTLLCFDDLMFWDQHLRDYQQYPGQGDQTDAEGKDGMRKGRAKKGLEESMCVFLYSVPCSESISLLLL